ncbi:manganese efflux pump MntP [Scatolibacter rhodanostii]|uniref:manganese efflux pump MntP n=1 Tax=Scatolibacter rhodanostii TaxID=2014781 RepID=UPI0035205ADA
MDAFAVAICKGLTMKEATAKKAITVGLYFGIFQALMPLIGYLVGMQFETQIKSIDHWIAFFLLAVIGVNMIIGSFKKEEESCGCENLRAKEMLPLALATSIDALAVGVTLAFLSTDIVPAVSFIGITTFSLSVIGVKVGHLVGAKFKSKAEFFGGVVLVIIGVKILLEHLGVLAF